MPRREQIAIGNEYTRLVNEIYDFAPTSSRFASAFDTLFTYLHPKVLTPWKNCSETDNTLRTYIGHSPWVEYDTYTVHLPFEKRILQPERMRRFEDKMTSGLIWSIVKKISQTPSNDHGELAVLLTSLQLVSNNLRFAKSRFSEFTQSELVLAHYANPTTTEYIKEAERYKWLFFDHFMPSIYTNYGRNPIDPGVYNIFAQHFGIWYSKDSDSGNPSPPNLVDAFFDILAKNYTAQLDSNPVINLELQYDRFARKYFEGLNVVAKVSKNGHNQIVYLVDHLERVFKSLNKWPKRGQIWDSQTWEMILLSEIDNPDLFNFLTPDAKVREWAGRYDYRALIDWLKAEGREKLQVLSFGFGKLGVASYELEKILESNGIKTDTIPVDILPPDSGDLTGENILVKEFLRNPNETVKSARNPRRAATRRWDKDELEALLSWRRKVSDSYQQGDILIGTVGIEGGADLVTLQGTVGSTSNLRERAAMIEYGIADVKPGGVFLLEGVITGTLQNVYSIAIQITDTTPRILYMRLGGRVRSNNTVFLNETLVANGGLGQLGKAYLSLPFDNEKLLLEAIYRIVKSN